MFQNCSVESPACLLQNNLISLGHAFFYHEVFLIFVITFHIKGEIDMLRQGQIVTAGLGFGILVCLHGTMNDHLLGIIS